MAISAAKYTHIQETSAFVCKDSTTYMKELTWHSISYAVLVYGME